MSDKVSGQSSGQSFVYVSGYFGRDVFDFVNRKREFNVGVPWGNSTLTARWNHVFSQKLFVNTTAVYNDYNFSFNALQNDFNIGLKR